MEQKSSQTSSSYPVTPAWVDWSAIRADLAKRELQMRQELTQNKPGHCPECLRNYSLPCEVIPLTELGKQRLLRLHFELDELRLKRSVKNQVRIGKSQGSSDRRGGSSNKTEGDGSTLTAEAEKKQFEKWLAEERHLERGSRQTTVRSFWW